MQAASDTLACVYKQLSCLTTGLLAKIKVAGVKVNKADEDAFIAASKPIYDEFAKEAPAGGKPADQAIALDKGMNQAGAAASCCVVLAARPLRRQ